MFFGKRPFFIILTWTHLNGDKIIVYKALTQNFK